MIDKHKALNALAREFYKIYGYVTPEGYDLSKSKHPQELLMYKMAEYAYQFRWEDYKEKENE